MTTNNIYTQLSDNLSKLGLSQIKLHFEKISSDITSNKISLTEGLLRLTNYEIDYKQKSAAMSIVKVAAFPYLKELKDFDFEFQPSINQQQILELANLGFINKAENIVFLGSSGVGKTDRKSTRLNSSHL